MKQTSITCHTCGMTSYHPEDIQHRYCGNCHEFLQDGTFSILEEDEPVPENRNWTAESAEAFAHKLAFGLVSQLTRLSTGSLSKVVLADLKEEIREFFSRSEAASLVEQKCSRLTLLDIANFCRDAKVKAAIVLYEDGDPENEKGLILPEVFVECWKRMKQPVDFFGLEGQQTKKARSPREYQ